MPIGSTRHSFAGGVAGAPIAGAPIAAATDVVEGLITLGLFAEGENWPLNLGTGALIAASLDVSAASTLLLGNNGNAIGVTFQKNQNTFTGVTVLNATSGTNAYAGFFAITDATGASFVVAATSTGFTPATPILAAQTVLAHTQGAGGMLIKTDTATPMVFGTNAVERGRFNAGGTRFETLVDIAANLAGKGIQIKEGANAKMGTADLVAGSAVVANTSVTATSRILITSQVDGGTPGFIRVSARTVGTSFTIISSNALDTSTVGWLILEPA